MSQTKTRLEAIDTLRGLALIGMILYHAGWDLVFLFNVSVPGYQALPGHIWQQVVCWTFILLAGFSWQLGRSHAKRGLFALAGGGLVTAITFFIMPELYVQFGILTFLGSCILLWILLDPFLKRIPPAVGIIGSFLLLVFCWNIPRHRYSLPGILGRSVLLRGAAAWLGFPRPAFTSSDYFPLLPWLFLFAAGYFLYSFLQKADLTQKWLSKGHIPIISTLGRHSLLVYLLHQPICYGVCFVSIQLIKVLH